MCGGWWLKFINEEGAGGKGGKKRGIAGSVCKRGDAVKGEGGEELAKVGAA